jgi:hypothetical protein
VAQSTPSLSAGREVRRHPQYGSSDDDQTASLRPIARVHNSAATTLFDTAGRFDIIEFWAYIAIVAAVSVLSLIILDADLMQERMRPGGPSCGLALSTDHYCHVPALDRKVASTFPPN